MGMHTDLRWAIAALLCGALAVGALGCNGLQRPPGQDDPESEPSARAMATATGAASMAPSATSGLRPSPTVAAARTATPLAGAYAPDLAWLAGQTYAGWETFEHPTFGFLLRYPSSWSLTEVTGGVDTMSGHRLDLTDGADPANRIHLAYRWADEAVSILPTGMGQGEVVARGSLIFMGVAVAREALVDRGADVRILYGGGGEIARGELRFWMDAYRAPQEGGSRDLPEEAQRTADAILSSLRWAAP